MPRPPSCARAFPALRRLVDNVKLAVVRQKPSRCATPGSPAAALAVAATIACWLGAPAFATGPDIDIDHSRRGDAAAPEPDRRSGANDGLAAIRDAHTPRRPPPAPPPRAAPRLDLPASASAGLAGLGAVPGGAVDEALPRLHLIDRSGGPSYQHGTNPLALTLRFKPPSTPPEQPPPVPPPGPLGVGDPRDSRNLYQPTYRVTHAHFLVPMEGIRAGSSTRKRQAL